MVGRIRIAGRDGRHKARSRDTVTITETVRWDLSLQVIFPRQFIEKGIPRVRVGGGISLPRKKRKGVSGS